MRSSQTLLALSGFFLLLTLSSPVFGVGGEEEEGLRSYPPREENAGLQCESPSIEQIVTQALQAVITQVDSGASESILIDLPHSIALEVRARLIQLLASDARIHFPMDVRLSRNVKTRWQAQISFVCGYAFCLLCSPCVVLAHFNGERFGGSKSKACATYLVDLGYSHCYSLLGGGMQQLIIVFQRGPARQIAPH